MAKTWVVVKGDQRSGSVANIAANGNANLIAYNVPTNLIMKIIKFGNYVQANALDWGFLQWAFRDNSIPISPLDQIKDQVPNQIMELGFKPEIHGGHAFTINALNLDGANTHGAGAIITYELGYYK